MQSTPNWTELHHPHCQALYLIVPKITEKHVSENQLTGCEVLSDGEAWMVGGARGKPKTKLEQYKPKNKLIKTKTTNNDLKQTRKEQKLCRYN